MDPPTQTLDTTDPGLSSTDSGPSCTDPGPHRPWTLLHRPWTLLHRPWTPRTLDPPAQTLDPPSQTLDPPAQTLDPPAQTLDPATQTLDPVTQTLDPATQTLDPAAQTWTLLHRPWTPETLDPSTYLADSVSVSRPKSLWCSLISVGTSLRRRISHRKTPWLSYLCLREQTNREKPGVLNTIKNIALFYARFANAGLFTWKDTKSSARRGKVRVWQQMLLFSPSRCNNEKQCSWQLQCEVPCSIGSVVNSSLFINSSLSSLSSTSYAVRRLGLAAGGVWLWGGGSVCAGGQGTFWSSCHVLHYHMVLRPKGTSNNKAEAPLPAPCGGEEEGVGVINWGSRLWCSRTGVKRSLLILSARNPCTAEPLHTTRRKLSPIQL